MKIESAKAFRVSMKNYEVQDQPLASGRTCRFVNLPLAGILGVGF